MKVYIRAFLLPLVLLASSVTFVAADEDSPQVKEFKNHIKKYIELHKKAKATVDPEEKIPRPADVVQQREKFAKAMQSARPNAARGDIFTPRVRRFFIEVINGELSAPAGKKARSMILGEGNPNVKGSPAPIALKVNTKYPTKAPKSTVPPSLLLALPELPEELEYGFVGRSLILHDIDADLIVDFIPNAVKP
jgi:hypothetical protein